MTAAMEGRVTRECKDICEKCHARSRRRRRQTSCQFRRVYLRHRNAIAAAAATSASSFLPSFPTPTPIGCGDGGGGDDLFGKRAYSPPSVSQSVSDSNRGGTAGAKAEADGGSYMFHAANRFSSACERSEGK